VFSDKFEDNKRVIRCRKSKNRQHNGQKKKDRTTNNDLQNITQKTKDRAKRITLKIRLNSAAPEGLAVPLLHVTPSCYC